MSTATITTERTTAGADRPPRRRGRRSRRVLGWLALAVALVVTVVWLFPFLVVVLTSLRRFGTLGTDVTTWFQDLTLANFGRAWQRGGFRTYVANSALVTVIKVPLGLVVSGMCAFGLSKFRFRFRRGVVILIVAASAVPIQIALISIFRMQLDLGLLNTYVGLILVYIAFGVPFQTIFLYSYFNQIPTEIEESARLDGVGPWRYLFGMLVPLSGPLLAALCVLDFVGTWNEFPIALTLLQYNEQWTVPIGLVSFIGPFTNDYQLLSAAIVMAALPVLVVYVLLQRYFVSGMLAGAVKG
jgi:raffinose/stachyose/melibiose transport system permease protein